MALAVASRYARALADLVLDPSRRMDPQAIVGELEVFENALSVSKELRNVMLSPAVTPPRKRAVIERLVEISGTSRLVRNFLYVIIDHRRIALLPEIRRAFQSAVDQRLGVVEAEITSAHDLAEGQRTAVCDQLVRITHKKVRCRFSVDENLIGGVLARIGSTIYDGSVRGQLEVLRRKLVE